MRPRSGLIAALLLATGSIGSAAQEMKPPRLSFAQVDWPAAIATLAKAEMQRSAKPRSINASRLVTRALAHLNTMMAPRFPGLASSPVPVLLPFDVDALTRDLAGDEGPADDDHYLSGFHAARFFYPGPAGYDAAFAIRTGEIAELSDIKFADPIEVQISGSRVALRAR